jgi:CRISPR-associated exonuclease Cas4
MMVSETKISENPETLISASALEKYGYCPLSWWLSRGEEDKDSVDKELLDKGEKVHEEVAEDLTGIVKGEKRAKEYEAVVLWFAIAATLISVMGITLVFEAEPDVSMIMGVISLIWILAACYFLYRAETIVHEKFKMLYQRIILIFAIVAVVMALNSLTLLGGYFSEDMARISQAAALAWLIGASFFLYRSLKQYELASFTRRKQKVHSQLTYIDSKEMKPKLLVSKKHGLSGRPDYVLLVDEHHLPVELKTGRVPSGPLFSHILQVAAYCLLLEEEFGIAPPHGIIRYGQAESEIEYDENLKQLVISKLAEMRELMKTGKAHRNHNKPGKCKSCSRRTICPEKLA